MPKIKEGSTSIAIRSVTHEAIRDWAAATGRTVGGLIDVILTDAVKHYSEGRKAGLDFAVSVMEGKNAQKN